MAGQTNTINESTYAGLLAAWRSTKSIRRSAAKVGVSPATASKYISSATLSDGRPGIKALLQNVQAKEATAQAKASLVEVEQLETRHANILLGHRGIARDSLVELAGQLKKIRLDVHGERMPDGSILVNEVTYRRVLSIARELFEYERALMRERLQMLMMQKQNPQNIPEVKMLPDEADPSDVQDIFSASNKHDSRSKAVGALQKFENTHLHGLDTDARAAVQRGLIEAFTKAAFIKTRGEAEQEELSRTASSESSKTTSAERQAV